MSGTQATYGPAMPGHRPAAGNCLLCKYSFTRLGDEGSYRKDGRALTYGCERDPCAPELYERGLGLGLTVHQPNGCKTHADLIKPQSC